MRETKQIAIAGLKENPLWARKGKIDDAVIAALAGSMKALGQQVPIITYGDLILDGHCRVLGKKFLGETHVEAIPLDNMPTEGELFVIQAAIDLHRSSLSMLQRSDLYAATMKANSWSVGELAKQLSI